MPRDNRPKMKGGFDFFKFYSENKNKVTKFGNGGIVVEDAKSPPAPAPQGINMGTGDRSAPAPSSGNQNRSGVTPVKAPGASSPSYRAAVEAGPDGKATPSSGNAGSGRGSTRTSPTGVQQSGTNTGFKGADVGMANQLLESLGISGVQYGEFSSNKLPGGTEKVKTEGKTDTEATLVGESTNKVASDGTAGDNSLQKPTDETNIVNQGYGLGSQERYNQEFLKDRGDSIGGRSESMVGLRAAEASKGLLYAGGKHYREDGQGGFTEISKEEFKSIKRGGLHAQEFANTKLTELTSNLDNKSNTYTVDTEATPTIGTDVDYAVPDAADMPEQGSLELTSAETPIQVPDKRREMYQTALQRRQGK